MPIPGRVIICNNIGGIGIKRRFPAEVTPNWRPRKCTGSGRSGWWNRGLAKIREVGPLLVGLQLGLQHCQILYLHYLFECSQHPRVWDFALLVAQTVKRLSAMQETQKLSTKRNVLEYMYSTFNKSYIYCPSPIPLYICFSQISEVCLPDCNPHIAPNKI